VARRARARGRYPIPCFASTRVQILTRQKLAGASSLVELGLTAEEAAEGRGGKGRSRSGGRGGGKASLSCTGEKRARPAAGARGSVGDADTGEGREGGWGHALRGGGRKEKREGVDEEGEAWEAMLVGGGGVGGSRSGGEGGGDSVAYRDAEVDALLSWRGLSRPSVPDVVAREFSRLQHGLQQLVVYVCPHSDVWVLMLIYCYICVLILLYMCPHAPIRQFFCIFLSTF
jgi:hypothetical protein